MLNFGVAKHRQGGRHLAGQDWFSKGRHGKIAKNMAVLGFGTALSQALNVIATPILSWYYSPESFGVMATALSIVYIFSSLANLNYDSSIVMPKEKDEAIDLLFLCLYMNFVSFFLFLVLSLTYFQFFENKLSDNYFLLSFLLSLGVLLLSAFNTLNFYAVRIEAYTSSSASQIFRTLSSLCVQILGILFSSSALWLISGRILGVAPALAYLVKRERTSLPNWWSTPTRARLIRAAKIHRRFPIFSAPQRIIALLSEEMPTLALVVFFGPGAAGHYWFSSRLLQMPCGVISSAIGRVFSREAVKKLHNRQNIFPPAIKIVVSLASLAIFPVYAVVAWASELFDVVLGNQWQTAAKYSQWIAIWVFFRFSIAPILCLFNILNQQKRLLQLDTIAFVLRVALLAYCTIALDAMAVVILLSIFESIKITTYGVIILGLTRRHDKHRLVSSTTRHLLV